MSLHDMFTAGLALLLAAVLVVPLAARLKIGSILGYLLAGIMVGPWGLGIIRDVDEILHFSELGVVLLLFVIGLELNPKKLWSLRQSIFGIGAAQVLLSAAILFAILYQYGFMWQTALIGGFGLAMSSTAIALQLMREKSLQYNESGQLAFAVLLFQDMAVIPILALIPLLAGNNLDANWQAISLKGLAFLGILLGGRYLLRPILRYIAASRVREVFTAATLLVVLGTAFLMDLLGFSMALGTFIAGVLLADSEYRHELESTIEPFKGLLLGLFFISVGMELNLSIFVTQWRTIVVGVILLLAVKMTVLYLLAWLKKLRRSERVVLATVLSQGGEFAFLLFSAALAQHLLKDAQLNLLLVVVTLSMMTTPLFMRLLENLLRYYYNRQAGRVTKPQQPIEDDEPQVIIVGFGRFGQVVGRLLMANQKRITVLEKNISTVSLMRRYGYNVYYGDATDLQLLRAAGIEKAKTLVITCNRQQDTLLIIQLCQQYFPHLHIMVRVHGRVEAHEVLDLGVKQFARETFLSALELGKKALVSLGMHPYQAYRAQQHFRHLDGNMLRELVPKQQNNSEQISDVKKARRELEEIFQREMQQEHQHFTQWEQNSE